MSAMDFATTTAFSITHSTGLSIRISEQDFDKQKMKPGSFITVTLCDNKGTCCDCDAFKKVTEKIFVTVRGRCF